MRFVLHCAGDFQFTYLYFLTCTCVGIHPGWVEPASPTALTTSRKEALQAQRSRASSLDTFTQFFSPSCVAEDSRSGGRFQVGLDRGNSYLQLASSSSAPCSRRCGRGKVLDQLTFGTSSKPAEPSLYEHCRCVCKVEAATQFHGCQVILTFTWEHI